ncbi:MAG: hypothetical protein FWH42_01425 [Dehalococcoidia bacterium]|nr:hypothetical protein [Dehalococcoidia bacterium]
MDAISTYDVVIDKIGRKWIEVTVKGKQRTYKAQLALDDITKDFKVGETHNVPAKFEDKSTKYGRKFELYALSPEGAVKERENIKSKEAEKWLQYMRNSEKEGYYYQRAENEIKALGKDVYDSYAPEMRAIHNRITDKKRENKGKQWMDYIRNSEEKGYFYDRGEQEIKSLGEETYNKYAKEIEEIRARVNSKQREEAVKRSNANANTTDMWTETKMFTGNLINKDGRVYKVLGSHYVASEDACIHGGWGDGYTNRCRDITDTDEGKAELARIEANNKKRAEEKAKTKKHEAMAKDIKTKGEWIGSADGKKQPFPKGNIIYDDSNVYGGGMWIIDDGKNYYFVKNNGADGDDWSLNTIQTAGAGAYGWKVPHSAIHGQSEPKIDTPKEKIAIRDDIPVSDAARVLGAYSAHVRYKTPFPPQQKIRVTSQGVYKTNSKMPRHVRRAISGR